MEETVPKVRGAADVTIIGLMVSLNRMEVGLGGKVSALDEIKERYGFETSAIVSMADDKLKAAIDTYYEQYGVRN